MWISPFLRKFERLRTFAVCFRGLRCGKFRQKRDSVPLDPQKLDGISGFPGSLANLGKRATLFQECPVF